jgi:hypothetical protein
MPMCVFLFTTFSIGTALFLTEGTCAYTVYAVPDSGNRFIARFAVKVLTGVPLKDRVFDEPVKFTYEPAL